MGLQDGIFDIDGVLRLMPHATRARGVRHEALMAGPWRALVPQTTYNDLYPVPGRRTGAEHRPEPLLCGRRMPRPAYMPP
ncbi:MAG: hypothetical protein ACXWQR_23040, partial [Ktedonobacterales bacterium]